MYEYKKIMFNISTGILINSKKGFEKMFDVIEEHAKDGWRFIQAINYHNDLIYMLIFEREKC